MKEQNKLQKDISQLIKEKKIIIKKFGCKFKKCKCGKDSKYLTLNGFFCNDKKCKEKATEGFKNKIK